MSADGIQNGKTAITAVENSNRTGRGRKIHNGKATSPHPLGTGEAENTYRKCCLTPRRRGMGDGAMVSKVKQESSFGNML